MTPTSQAGPIPLVVWGASGHARVVTDMIRLAGTFRIVAFLDDVHPDRTGTSFCGAPILGGREQLPRLREDGVKHLLVAIGDCRTRLALADVAIQHGFDLATIVHPRAVVAGDVLVAHGTVVMAGAVINPGCTIEDNVIINTSSSVDHDSIIHSGAHVGPGVHIGGSVVIGPGTWIGIGTILKDNVTIGRGAVVGAGAVVLKDIPDGVVAFGTPARVIRAVE
jgi:UDP-N-acetylbacillosamine N-acetyltransferase